MSNGYLLAADADLAGARDIADGFGLDAVGTSAFGDHEATAAALGASPNVGLILSNAAASDAAYVALLQTLAQRLLRAQLIVVDPDAREKFAFLPTIWPAMSLDEARTRAGALARQRAPGGEEPPRAHPLPVEPPAETGGGGEVEDLAPEPEPTPEPPPAHNEITPEKEAEAPATQEEAAPEILGGVTEDEPPAPLADEERSDGVSSETPAEQEPDVQSFGADEPPPPPASVAEPEMPPAPEPPTLAQPPMDEAATPDIAPQAPAPEAPPPSVAAPSPPARKIDMDQARAGAGRARSGETAPADATAFAPKKLRRATPELVRIVVHQPKDLQAVIKAARKLDPRTEAAPQGMNIGDIAIGASVGVALEVRGAQCDGTLQRRTWTGEPIDFSFSAEAAEGVKQAVFLARVFVDDAQIGVLAFTRNVSGPSKKPASDGDRVRLKRHKRVFLSYSSKDRETVSQIATAYQMAGVEHFWDRSSLKSGEEWHPRLRREIDRADLFHLCWSRAASESEWVQKEAEHALTRRKKNSGKPEITVQMLDGPPWAPHPDSLDSVNFDDFVRAAIVGYARGDGS